MADYRKLKKFVRKELGQILILCLLLGIYFLISYSISRPQTNPKDDPDDKPFNKKKFLDGKRKFQAWDSANNKLQFNWLNAAHNFKHISIQIFSDDRYVSGSELYYLDGNKNKVCDFNLSYKIKLYKHYYDKKHSRFNFIFIKESIQDLKPDDKNKICDSELALEIPLTRRGIYPSASQYNNRFLIWLSKITNKCHDIQISYRAACDDIILRDPKGILLGKIPIAKDGSDPILITNNPNLSKCYPKIKLLD